MGATRYVVHLCRCLNSSLLPPEHQVVCLLRCPHGPLGQALNKDTPLSILSDLQARPLSLQQIRDGLIVNLQVARSDHECHFLSLLRANVGENFLHGARYDASLVLTLDVAEAFHCVSFASACLAVGENRCVVAREHIKHSRLCCLLVDLGLSGLVVVNAIKAEKVARLVMRVALYISLTTFFSHFVT